VLFEGIAVTMWMAIVTEANWVVWATVLNACIHTLMYTYYAAATLGYRSPLASILTNMQLLQFLTGIVVSTTSYFYEECASATPGALQGLLTIQVYAVGLIHLFNEMYKQKYNSKRDSKKKA
jgi:hypothetical protein